MHFLIHQIFYFISVQNERLNTESKSIWYKNTSFRSIQVIQKVQMYTLRNRSKSSNNSSCSTLWIFQSPRWQSLPQYCATEHFAHFFNSVLAKQNQHNSLHFCVKLGICTPYLAAMNLRILMSYKFSLGQNWPQISKTNFCSIFSSGPQTEVSFCRGIFSMGAEPLR